MTNEEYVEANHSMFDGPDETEIRCRTVKVITVRKPQQCMCPGCFSSPNPGHMIQPGQRAVVDRAIADGSWGSCYTCLPCLESWWNHCRDGCADWCTEARTLTPPDSDSASMERE